MSASWYDVLGVTRDAGTEEIRAAWKDSIADLDPTDRRFALYNEAAEVLLDDEKRAAYDEELSPAYADEPTPDADEESAADDKEGSAAEPGEAETTDHLDPTATARPTRARWSRAVPNWALLLLLVATLAVAGVAFWLHHDSGADPQDVEDQVTAARTAAEDSVPKVLTYDYRYPERDHDRAMEGLTTEFGEKYDQIWNDAILPNLTKAKATAESTVLGTGVVRASDDGNRVELVVVLSSRTGNRNVSTELPPLPMTVRMVESNGEWLIEDMDLWEPEQTGQQQGQNQNKKQSRSPDGASD